MAQTKAQQKKAAADKAAAKTKEAAEKTATDEVLVDEDADYEVTQLPDTQLSTFLRNHFKSPNADGRFIWKDTCDVFT